jgi:ketosteroid isomerase-like protein
MIRLLAALCLLLAGCASAPKAPAPAVDVAALTAEVTAAETAFAKTMADRDFDAFASYLADDAVFINGRNAHRGKSAILAAWKEYFSEPMAPFSWSPETVNVLATGELAQSKGPVLDPAGKPILEFRSTWRREPSGEWKIVFDDGTCLCGRPQ